ncbi:M56 family metallopeptidase [Undibacterium sp. TS12]|uniref:M56 family metallopeptidase n=1 Tax=Undibacterium sp. TS12 TaxID=2908202 RepID=UPI001F4C6A9E|nr:M56 family metallopeptidase [Undibacterium sp. TS12]MCH8618441.1 M56 family metallopeptidase [Undibacterium sp. TS12]
MSQSFQHIVNALGWALLHFVWQGSLIALLLAALLNLMAHAQARTRYAVAYTALIVCIYLPVSEFFVRLGKAYTGKEVQAFNEVPLQFRFDSSHVLVDSSAWLDMHLSDIVIAWMICVAALALRMCMGLLWITTCMHPERSKPHPDWQARIDRMSGQFHICSRVIFRVVEDLSGPVTVGIVRPMILLPGAMLTGMPVDLLEMLVAHEMGHIKRHDYLLNLIQTAIETLLFYHPAVWWISKQIRSEREEIADAIAARVTGEPRRLALALSELANFQFITPQLAQAAHGGNLMSRIKRLLQPEIKNVSTRGILGLFGAVATTLVYAGQALTSLPGNAVTQVEINTQPVANTQLSAQANSTYLPKEKVNGSNPVSPAKPEIKLALLQSRPKPINKIVAVAAPVAETENQDAVVDKSTGSGQDVIKPVADKVPVAETSKQHDAVVARPKFSYDFSACYPAYPRSSLRNNETGATSLAFKVGADGVIDNVKVASSSGFPDLDNAAAQAFQGCKVKPAQVDGEAVAKNAKIKFVWQLK